MSKTDEQFERIEAIIRPNADKDFSQTVATFFQYLKDHLQLPCRVTGTEDFRWEEPYVLGGWSPEEYEKLKKTQPSYTDRYDLLEIEEEGYSEWIMCGGEDIAAHVKRISDGKEFVLGLSELKAADKKSTNFQLIEDYAVFFGNYR